MSVVRVATDEWVDREGESGGRSGLPKSRNERERLEVFFDGDGDDSDECLSCCWYWCGLPSNDQER